MAKYQVKQSMVLCGPLSNAMLFIPMFFGLRKMGEYVPGEEAPHSTGRAYGCDG